MAGTIPLSMTQQFDPLGDPLSGGQLFFFVAGTVSTPQNAFKDLALTLPHPNPITLDAAGRVPQLFIADGVIKIRLTDQHGVVQLVADNIQVIGASSGGGGGSAVDATTVFSTGDVKPRYGTGNHSGWVRANARTIGTSVSGATERANADCQPLFQYLWGIDPSLVVVGGRGGTSLADWNANKQLTLPDGRGVVLAGLDDMGNTAAGRLGTFFGNGTVLGALGGTQSHALTTTEMPSHQHTGLTGNDSPDHTHTYTYYQGVQNMQVGGNSLGTAITTGTTAGANTRHTHAFTTDPSGSSQPFAVVQPTMVVTIYLKL